MCYHFLLPAHMRLCIFKLKLFFAGHGKLIMADGSYYEGEFKDGEIDGHGFRKWQHNGNCYSGEFLKYVMINRRFV